MSTTIVYNGTSYVVPAVGDSGWGASVSAYLIALATGSLTKAGGTVTLAADANFGSSFGLISKYFTSASANPAGTGVIRLANGDSISFRNSGNTADIALSPGADGVINYGGVALLAADSTATLTNKTIDGGSNTLTNIGYSSLVLTGAVVNADISSSAAIAYTKLSLAGSVVNADIATGAAIAYSKLSLSGSIVNADISSSAAIAYSKLALTGAILNADLAGSIAYSKLTLTGSIVNADISGTAAIAYSKLALTGAILNADLAGSITAAKLVGSDIATVGTVTTGTWNATTVAVNHGGTGATSVTTAAAASSWAGWDANKNLSANAFLQGYTTTATAAGTTTLTVASTQYQFFTGSTTQTVKLPVTSTLVLGQAFTVVNNSTGAVTVQSSGGNTIALVNGSSSTTFACILTSGTTAASWSAVGSGSTSPLTTKGDIYTYDTNNQRQAVPGDYGHLAPDSAQTTGWKSAAYNQYLQGSPFKNYIQYADFDNQATTGWTLGTIGTLTNGLPTGTPAFGSGASVNLSIAAVTSGTLAGIASMSLASSAATVAGNMVASSAYTLDIEDQARVLTYKVYYKASSGATNLNLSGTSSNSVGVAVWDATNSVWLPVAGAFNFVQSSGVGIATGTLQTGATTASVRLCLYFPNASAGAATLLLKDFYLGPQVAMQAPSMSDWVSETGWTFSAGFGTVTSQTVFTKREGDMLRVRAFCVAGTTAASVASLTPPAKYTIDQTKGVVSPSQSALVGDWWAPTPSGTPAAMASNNNTGPAFTDGTNNAVYFAYQGQSAQFVKNNANNVLSNNNAGFMTELAIPISGWSSNSVASSDTDTRVISFEGTLTSTQAITANVTNIATQTTVKDSAGAWSGSIYTVPVSGDYVLAAGLAGSASTTFNAVVYTNGVAGTRLLLSNASVFASGTILLAGLKAGDTVALRSDTSLTLAAVGSISIFRLSGPAVITATESVNGRYFSSVSAITGSDATVTYATKDFDSHNAYSGGTLTIPVSGKYQFNAALELAGTYAINQAANISVYKNGTQINLFSSFAGGSQAAVSTALSDIVNCLAGDLITIKANSGATSPSIQASNFRNYFSWARVGN